MTRHTAPGQLRVSDEREAVTPPAPLRPVAPSTSSADRERMLAMHPLLRAAAEAWAQRSARNEPVRLTSSGADQA